MNPESTNINTELKKATQKRVLGCTGWGLLLALFASAILILVSDVIRYEKGTSAFFPIIDNVEAVIVWFLFFSVPIIILAIIFGKVFGQNVKFWPTFVVIFPIVSTIYLFFLYFMYSLPLGSPSRTSAENFWHPLSIGLTALVGSLILGILASYGYWHAGRKKQK
ncbi:MAG: hypothetical protein ACYDET_09685 [Thermoleophilia bacterium]